MKCDYCKNKAVVNFQRVWKAYAITANNDYKPIPTPFKQSPEGTDNLHLCKQCAIKKGFDY